MCISLVRGRQRVDLEFCQRAENGKMISRGDYRGRPGLSRGRTAVGEGVGGETGLWVGHPLGARTCGRVRESGDGMHEIAGVPSSVRTRSRCECGSGEELVEGRRKLKAAGRKGITELIGQSHRGWACC